MSDPIAIRFRHLSRSFRSSPFGLFGLLIVILLVAVGILGQHMVPYDPFRIDPTIMLRPPSFSHPFGTDNLGRDVFSRVVAGTRIAMGVGVLTIGLSLLLGLILGLAAGYGPRWIDNLLLLIFDSVLSFPTVILGLTVVALLGASFGTLLLVIVTLQTPAYARLVRSSVLSIKGNDYIRAIEAMGASRTRVVTLHLLPNVIGPLLIIASMDIPAVIALEAGLTYLGMGLPPPTPSWGRILQEGFAAIRTAPWIVVAAGLPLIISTLGFTFLGEFLRDRLDPKMRKTR